MIRFYFHPTPNPAKVALFLEEAGLAYEVVPVDTRRASSTRRRFAPSIRTARFRRSSTPKAQAERGARVRFERDPALPRRQDRAVHRRPADRPELLSWLFFIASGIGPFSGQAVHFQHAAPEKLPYAINRYRREVERHYRVLDDHLAGREFIVGDGLFDRRHVGLGLARSRRSRASRRQADGLAAFPNLERWYAGHRRASRGGARPGGRQGSCVQDEVDEESRRAMFPSNYPPAAE